MKYIFTTIFIIFTIFSNAQLVTSTDMSPGQLVQEVLLGSGVEVSNVVFSGASNAIGRFDASNSSIGIDEGIILTTGTVLNQADGPHGPNDKPNAGLDNGAPGYSQLSSLVGTNTYNAALLEFDFVPYSDTVRFKYVFASEEYPEYVGSEFNDVFAFFISGPGINGMKNMAIIPGTTQPVTINNVNQGQNQQYYVYNGTGNNSPYNSNPYYVQYDGFTTPLEAVSKVECGETYHLVIAIADVADAIYDSGIFLEKNSLTSEQPVEVSYQLLNNPYGDGVTMAQNCTSAKVTITRTGNMIDQALTVPINISGTAVEGLDYSTIPTEITFNPGETEISFIIDALNNPNLTGTVNIELEFEIEDACGGEEFQRIELFIKPVDPVEVILGDTTVLCPDQEVELVPEVTGGGGDYSYSWSTGETTETIAVSPTTTQTYTVSVTDECLGETASATAEVEVPEFQPLAIQVSDDITEDCPYIENNLFVEVIGGSGNYTFQWKDEDENSMGASQTLSVSPYETTTYTVIVKDFCGEIDSAEVTVTVTSPPLELEIIPEQEICKGDSIQLTVEATGGFGNYYYYWPETGDTTQSIWVNPEIDSTYHVIVKDDCQTFQVNTHTKVKVVQPVADFEIVNDPVYEGLEVTFSNRTQGGDSYWWDFGDGSTSTFVHPNNVYHEQGEYIVTLIAEDENGCRDTISKPIRILEEFFLYVPNSFTPDGNQFNDFFLVSAIGVEQFHMRIYNRWGEMVFETKDLNVGWDGVYGGMLVKDGTYIWRIDYKTVNDDEDDDMRHMEGHINVLR